MKQCICYECEKECKELSPESRCLACTFRRMKVNETEAEKLHGEVAELTQCITTMYSDDKFAAHFRDFYNNYLTIEKYAEHQGVSVQFAKHIIRIGRIYHEANCIR